MCNKNKVLLIGPRFSGDGKVGGITVLFENLLMHLKDIDNFIVLDSNAVNHNGKIGKLLNIFFKILTLKNYRHVALNGTAQDYLFIGPLLVILSKFFLKSYSLRKFAGNFDDYYQSSGICRKFILDSVLKNSSANYFETKALVQKFKSKNKNTFWFPNVRPVQVLKSRSYHEGEKFQVLFLSQLMKEKGIQKLIEAVSAMENVCLNIAGPVVDIELEYIKNFNDDKIKYLGVVNSEDVYQVMRDNHCLALPTFYPGEGYPGVIIEAFMVGLPVLTTNWNSLPELLNQHGVIIENAEVNNIKDGLYDLIYHHEHYAALSSKRGNVFSDVDNTESYLAFINGKIK